MAKKKTTKKTTKKITKRAVKKVVNKAKSKKTTTKAVAKKKVSAKKIAKKVAKKTAKKIAKKVAKKTVKKTAKKVARKTAKKVAKKVVKKVVKKVTKTPVAKKTRRRKGVSVSEAAREAETDDRGFVYINGRRVRMIETQGVVRKKKRTSKSITEESTVKKTVHLKSPFTAKQLREYREYLLTYRARLLIDLGAIEKEALDANADSSHMPIHMADVGSDAYDQDLKLGMAASERKRIRDIEDALVRIKRKTYGVCHMTGKLIPEARLLAKPWAKYTKESAEKFERLNRQR